MKKITLSLLGTYATVPASARNIIDSSLSNHAGLNSGNTHTGLFIFICMFLVLAVVIAYR